MHFRFLASILFAFCIAIASQVVAQASSADLCSRGAVGSTVPEPADLRSVDGHLRVELSYRTSTDEHRLTRYCYLDMEGRQSPTLRVKPGAQVTILLHNDLPADAPSHAAAHQHTIAGACASGAMTSSTTNLHFHGLTIPPVCHQDETLKTMIQPSDEPFEYNFKIPADQPPGLYWYHPHVHGFNRIHILGGASGALIVEGLEAANREVSGLPERVFVIRDQELIHPDAAPEQTDSMPAPQVLRDAEGDILNSGTGTGKPAKDLSINFVPVPYPKYQPAVISMKPQEQQLWRVLNASAITYLDLQVLFNDFAQPVDVVAIDGVPVNFNGNTTQTAVTKKHLLVPPAGRVEFIVKAPKAGVRASLVTRTVDTGPAGENDPTRPLATIITSDEAPEPQSVLPASPAQQSLPRAVPLKDVTPVRTRKLYFSEASKDPKSPNSPTVFYITVDGSAPAVFDPTSPNPNLLVNQGDVEDWIIENRTTELHDFHIHEIHYQLVQWNGVPVDEPYLRDTVNVPYWDGTSPVYPSVKLRMDFRSPSIVGTFVYHCHLLEHEDAGMMGTIRVDPPAATTRQSGSLGLNDKPASQNHSSR